MCLKIGDTEYCIPLRNAPMFNGRSLERLQHDIEENDPHVQQTPELQQAVADACGLTMEEYRARCAMVRGQNAIIAFDYEDVSRIGRKVNPVFAFSEDCGRWVRGEIHEYPGVDWIAPQFEDEVRINMTELRYRWFKHQLNNRGPVPRIWEYPERILWHSQLCFDIGSGRQRAPVRQLRNLLIKRRTLDITLDVRLTVTEIDKVIEMRSRDFLLALWLPDRDILYTLINREEAKLLEQFASRRENLAAHAGKRTHGHKKRRARYHTEFNAWRLTMQAKYQRVFAQRLREHLCQNNLAGEFTSQAA